MSTFEIGAYCHRLEEADPQGIDHLTCLDPVNIKEFQKKYPRIQLSVAVKAGEKPETHKHVTILASQGMALGQECLSLQEKGYQVRIAIPAQIELLKSFQLGGLDVTFDLMAYDYAAPVEGERTSFHSLIYNGESPSIQNTLSYLHDQRVALKKVNLGLSTEGVLFKNVEPGMTTGFGQHATGEQLKEAKIDVFDYLEKHPMAKTYYTSFAGCFQSFIYNHENGDWISYDDFKTIQSKIEWARHRGLHGIFIN